MKSLQWLDSIGVDLKARPGVPIEVRSPINGEIIAEVNSDTHESAEHQVQLARQAFSQWRAIPAPKRGELIRLQGDTDTCFIDIGYWRRAGDPLFRPMIDEVADSQQNFSLGKIHRLRDPTDDRRRCDGTEIRDQTPHAEEFAAVFARSEVRPHRHHGAAAESVCEAAQQSDEQK